jgi:hypothetical protein
MTLSNVTRTMRFVQEVTYKTDPGSGYKDIPVEDAASIISRGKIDNRPQAAGHVQGMRRSLGMWEFGASGRTLLRPVTVADTNSRALQHLIYKLIGFGDPTYAAGPPKTLTYSLLSHNHASVTIHDVIREYGSSTVTELRKILGARASANITLQDGQLAINWTAQGADGSSAASTAHSEAFLDNNTTLTLTLNDAAVALGAYVRSFSLDLNMSPVVIPVGGNGGKPYAVELRPSTITGTVTINRPPKATADFTALQADTLTFSLKHIDDDASGNATYLNWSADFAGDPLSFEDNVGVMEIPFVGLWADDGTDVGRTPADNILQIVHETT